MELGIAQSRLGNAVDRGRRDDPAKRAGNTVALVIGHDEQNVRRTLGRHDARRPPGNGILSAFLDHATEFRGQWRKLFSVECGGGAGRARNTSYLLIFHLLLLVFLLISYLQS